MAKIQIKGLDEAINRMKQRSKLFQGRGGRLYKPAISNEVAQAIKANADGSYEGSPAKSIAIKSVTNWTHESPNHVLPIMSTDYANYRQYGCGGIPIVKLVIITEADRDRIRKHFSQAFQEPDSMI